MLFRTPERSDNEGGDQDEKAKKLPQSKDQAPEGGNKEEAFENEAVENEEALKGGEAHEEEAIKDDDASKAIPEEEAQDEPDSESSQKPPQFSAEVPVYPFHSWKLMSQPVYTSTQNSLEMLEQQKTQAS